jgi:hypothetical protein
MAILPVGKFEKDPTGTVGVSKLPFVIRFANALTLKPIAVMATRSERFTRFSLTLS